MAAIKATTPLPRLPIGMCCVTQLAFGVFVTLPFTTFVYMVQDFYPTASDASLSRRTGLLASLSNLSMFVSSIPWGLVTDKRGRRPVLNVGNWSAAVTVLLLGFAPNYGFACACRVVGGLLNGTLGAMKAVIADVTDDTNAPLAFSALSVAWGVGAVLGPALGGLLSRPCREGGLLFGATSCSPGSILSRMPYILPCLFCSFLCGLAGCLSLRLPETIHRPGQPPIDAPPRCVDDAEDVPLLQPQSTSELELQSSSATPDVLPPVEQPTLPPTPVRWFRDRQCVLCLLGYALCAFIFIQMDELLPLFAAAEEGLGMSPRSLSAPLAFGGAVVFAFTLFCYPPMVRRVGLRTSTRGGYLVTSLSTLIVPVAALATGGLRSAILYIAIAFRSVAAVTVFTSSMLMVNKSAPAGQLGEVNGMGQCLAALVRGLGPAIAGLEWGASVKSSTQGAHFLPFLSISLMALIGIVLYGEVDFSKEQQGRMEEAVGE